jgi:predicted TIM-barrel fold metal-dependent hydrolase
LLIHCGDYRFDYSNPNRIEAVLKAFPRLTVIGAHLGGWSVWEEAVERLAHYPNFLVDTSSSLYALTPERAKEIIRRFGADRVLFGTDYPMWDVGDELSRFHALDLTVEEEEKILSGNAVRLFGFQEK